MSSLSQNLLQLWHSQHVPQKSNNASHWWRWFPGCSTSWQWPSRHRSTFQPQILRLVTSKPMTHALGPSSHWAIISGDHNPVVMFITPIYLCLFYQKQGKKKKMTKKHGLIAIIHRKRMTINSSNTKIIIPPANHPTNHQPQVCMPRNSSPDVPPGLKIPNKPGPSCWCLDFFAQQQSDIPKFLHLGKAAILGKI